jgi:hypothetical protein
MIGSSIEVVLDDLRHEGVDHLVVGHAGARGVGDADIAGASRRASGRARPTRNPAEGFRIEEVVVDAPIDDIDPAQAGDGLHVDAIVLPDDQIAAFDQAAPIFCAR